MEELNQYDTLVSFVTLIMIIVIKITDSSQARFEVPLETPVPTTKAPNPNYEFIVDNSPIFSFSVRRKDTGNIM